MCQILLQPLNDTVRMLNFLVEKQETASTIPAAVVKWASAPSTGSSSVWVILTNITEGLKSSL